MKCILKSLRMTSTLINTIERPHAYIFSKSLSADKHNFCLYVCPCGMTMVSILLSVSILSCIVLSGKFEYKKKHNSCKDLFIHKKHKYFDIFLLKKYPFCNRGKNLFCLFYLFWLMIHKLQL